MNLARGLERRAAAGVVYSLAYGDQPALICEQVDWARTAGFRRADVAAVAKRELAAGEELDGEGGYTVWGKQLPAARSLENR